MTPQTIHIHINRRPISTEAATLTGDQILGLGDYGNDYDLYLLQGEGDPTGGRKVEPSESVALKNGMHFRAIPNNANFGAGSR
ncbi:MAG: multiubiquitin domain-containing protein [Actinobacteria bacterium]|nr:multiubiquitin domain-containing protein [Actinomycetota bacterium]